MKILLDNYLIKYLNMYKNHNQKELLVILIVKINENLQNINVK